VVKDEGANRPVGMLARIPDKQTAMLITTMAAALKTARIERGVDARLSRATCERTDHGRLWILERMLELPRAADEACFFYDGCPRPVSG